MTSISTLQPLSRKKCASDKGLDGWSLVVAVNNDNVLQQTLLASPAIHVRPQVILKRGFASAGQAYNSGLAEAKNEIVVFAHQDVYLPESWVSDLERALMQLAEADPDWGVLGVFGSPVNQTKGLTGYCYSTGLDKILGERFTSPEQAMSLDEMVLVVRRSAGLIFDEQLPGFHLYGTDICMQAQTHKLRSYIVPAFCIHNSNGLAHYPTDYWRSYLYMRRKWRKFLPIVTCCATITRSYRPMLAQMFSDLRRKLLGGPTVGKRTSDVSGLYRRVMERTDTLARTASVGLPTNHWSDPMTGQEPSTQSKADNGSRRDPLQIIITGVSFDTANMGVSALATGAIKCAIDRFPDASVSILDYGREAKTYSVQLKDRNISVPLINIRFSKKVYLSNNIAWLLFIAAVLRLIRSRELREWLICRNACLKEITRSDVVAAISGGDSFSDIYGLQRLAYVSLPQIVALFLGKRLVLLPQTIGPFRSKLSRLVARYILHGAERVFTRDLQSLKEIDLLLKDANAAKKCAFCYDVGCVVDPIAPREMKIGGGLSLTNLTGRHLVGLNISGLLWMGGYNRKNMFGLTCEYDKFTYSLLDCLIDRLGTNALLVPHVFGTDPHGESDAIVCEQVYANLKEKYKGRIGVVEGTLNQSEVKYVIGSCELFIGARMHACLAALSQCVPAISLAYSDKFIGVMQSLSVGSLVLDLRTMDKGQMLRSVASTFNRRIALRQELERQMPKVRQTVSNLFEFVDSPEPLTARL